MPLRQASLQPTFEDTEPLCVWRRTHENFAPYIQTMIAGYVICWPLWKACTVRVSRSRKLGPVSAHNTGKIPIVRIWFTPARLWKVPTADECRVYGMEGAPQRPGVAEVVEVSSLATGRHTPSQGAHRLTTLKIIV